MSGLDQTFPDTDRSSARPHRRLNVVMADDDHNDHLLMSMAADAAGIDVEFTFHDDGSMLLARLESLIGLDALPDLVILDLRMPGLGGHHTLERIQGHDVLWQLPVIVFSTSTRRDDESRAYANGAHWFVTKPSTFGGMVEFAESLPRRANQLAYDLTRRRPDGTPVAAGDIEEVRDAAFIDEIERFLESGDGI